MVTQVNNAGRNYYTISIVSIPRLGNLSSFKKMSEIDLMQKLDLAAVEVDTAEPL